MSAERPSPTILRATVTEGGALIGPISDLNLLNRSTPPDVALDDGRMAFSRSENASLWSTAIFSAALKALHARRKTNRPPIANMSIDALRTKGKTRKDDALWWDPSRYAAPFAITTGIYPFFAAGPPTFKGWRIALRIQFPGIMLREKLEEVIAFLTTLEPGISAIASIRETRAVHSLEARGPQVWKGRRPPSDRVHVGDDIALDKGPASAATLMVRRRGETAPSYQISAGHGFARPDSINQDVFHPTPSTVDASTPIGWLTHRSLPPEPSLRDLSTFFSATPQPDAALILLEPFANPSAGAIAKTPDARTIAPELSPLAKTSESEPQNFPELWKTPARSNGASVKVTAFGVNLIYGDMRSGRLFIASDLVETASTSPRVTPARKGDSGALLLDSSNRPFGYVVAGAATSTILDGTPGAAYVQPLKPVFDTFDLEFAFDG